MFILVLKRQLLEGRTSDSKFPPGSGSVLESSEYVDVLTKTRPTYTYSSLQTERLDTNHIVSDWERPKLFIARKSFRSL